MGQEYVARDQDLTRPLIKKIQYLYYEMKLFPKKKQIVQNTPTLAHRFYDQAT